MAVVRVRSLDVGSADDWSVLRDSWNALVAYAHSLGNKVSEGDEVFDEVDRRALLDADARVWIVEEGHRIVGCCALAGQGFEDWEVMFAYGTSREGFLRALRAALAWALENGVTRLCGYVFGENAEWADDWKVLGGVEEPSDRPGWIRLTAPTETLLRATDTHLS